MLSRILEVFGPEIRGWLLAWARVAPAVVLVPAFGLRAIPLPARAAMGLALGAAIVPSLRPLEATGPLWPWALLVESLRGLPVALVAASVLWVATMTGGLVDNLRGAQERQHLPNVETDASPMGALLAMLAAILFLQTGGPAHLVERLMAPEHLSPSLLVRTASALTCGVGLAIEVAAPLAVTSLVVETSLLLIARAAQPAPVLALVAPLRTMVLLGVSALLLDRMLVLLRAILQGF